MGAVATLALLGMVPVAVVLFALLDVRRAFLATYLVGTLFLPIARIRLTGLPDFDKSMAMGVGAVIGLLVFGSRQLSIARFGAYDLPALALCASSGLSSLVNGNGLHDAISAWLGQTIHWGVPYLAGRICFRRRQDLYLLATALFAGGLVYLPLCAYEIRMSPQLHRLVYGYFQHDFTQTMRGGGFRPTVFMQHGLMVGLWMCSTALVGIAVWRRRLLERVFGIPVAYLAIALCGIAVLCKSTGATVLLLVALLAAWEARAVGTRLLPWLIVIGPWVYVTVRILGVFDGQLLVDFAGRYSELRAASLAFRFHMENLVLGLCTDKPWFGWSQWGTSLPPDLEGNPQRLIIDSLWADTFFRYGTVGLASLLTMLTLPIVLMLRYRPRLSFRASVNVPYGALALIVGMFAIDCMANNMFNPLYVLVAGALTGIAVHERHPGTVAAGVGGDARIQRPTAGDWLRT